MPEIAASHNILEYSVSEISGALKRVVEDNFGYVRVRGELTGWKIVSSGHAYPKLKDEKNVLEIACWKPVIAKLPFKPEDGMEVICTGRITTYPGRSQYQLILDRMEPAGVGALMAMLEQRKKKLEAEGLFRPERKKKLPFLPEVIGVITSPTGAVIRDILHRIADRFPRHVLVWPVAVQGEGAAEQIAAAIAGFNAMEMDGAIPRPDVLIVARGGGSLEDLWAFNEEIVVRAAAASAIPLISAVGHETDTTLIDFASDMRAPTPTAAAELAVPVRQEWQITVMDHARRLAEGIVRLLKRQEEAVTGMARGLPRPSQLLDHAQQRIDDWTERLAAALPGLIGLREKQLAVIMAVLKPRALMMDVERHEKDLRQFADRLSRNFLRALEVKEQHLATQSAMLDSLNYTKVLERGFAMVKNDKGALVSRAAQVQPGQGLVITFKDGERKVRAEKDEKQGTLL